MFDWLKNLSKRTMQATKKQPGPVMVPPPDDFLKRLGDHFFTPDVMTIESYDLQLFFVCDEMMRNRPNHSIINDAVFLANAFTCDEFALWRNNNQTEKSLKIIPLTIHAPRLPVKGELYAIKAKSFLELDKHKLNGVAFNRRRVKIDIPFRSRVKTRQKQGTTMLDQQHWLVNAWMYVGKDNRYEDRLDAGFEFLPVQTFSPNNFWIDKYYFATPKEFYGI